MSLEIVLRTPTCGGGTLGGILAKTDRNQVQAYEDLCRELGEQPANVALAWLLHQDGVTAPIIGRAHDPATGGCGTRGCAAVG